jgi:hypothetical protein
MENATAKNEIEDWMLVFAKVEPQIKRALKYSGGTHTSEDIFIGIANGVLDFWARNGSVIITEIIDHPQMRVLNVFLAAGKMEDLESVSSEVEEYARQAECSRITLLGRQGWTRSFLKDMGFAPKWQVLAKDL